jgi:hypothetical protein
VGVTVVMPPAVFVCTPAAALSAGAGRRAAALPRILASRFVVRPRVNWLDWIAPRKLPRRLPVARRYSSVTSARGA